MKDLTIIDITNAIKGFLSRKILKLRRDKWNILWEALFIFPSFLGVFIIRALRPLALIRLGSLRSRRFGHFAVSAELYLCQKEFKLNGDNHKVFDIFFHTSPVSNRQLKKMWDRNRDLRIINFARWVYLKNISLPEGEKYTIPASSDRDIHNLLDRTQPHLSFTAEEECLGEKAKRNLGINNSAPFICFHARDSAYLDKQFGYAKWEYQNYRDSHIENYIPAASEMTRRGYFTIRMGHIVKEALNTNNPMIIDYASKHRTDFLDIYLAAKCRFFIISCVGLANIPMIFRRPIAWVNFIPLEHLVTWGKANLIILKKIWMRNEKRFMTFREILDSGAGRYLTNAEYEKASLEVIENTPEEIMDLAIEMDERLKGTWKETEEDKELQKHFWLIFKPNDLRGESVTHIGAIFLRQNKELLQ